MKEVYEHPDDLTPKFRKECKKTVSQICCKFEVKFCLLLVIL